MKNLTLQKGTSPYFKVMKRRTDSLEIPFSSPNDHDQAPSYSWPFKTKVMLGRAWLCIRKNSPTQEIDSNSFSSDSNSTAAHSVICWQNRTKCSLHLQKISRNIASAQCRIADMENVIVWFVSLLSKCTFILNSEKCKTFRKK